MKKFDTKYGYFSKDGNEYVIKTPRTPKPWINVISNGEYGMTISQAGGGFSWLNHSEFNRITRWHQDLIQDNWGKYIYIKNNDTGEIWSPTWMPVKTELDEYECHVGLGYTKFFSSYKKIRVELTFFVPFDDTLEIWDLKIFNDSKKSVNLSVFTYFEWVLGSSNDYHREFHKLFLETEFDEKLNAITAKKRLWDIPLGDRGHWNIDYEYTGFFSCNKTVSGYDGDKESFIGQYGGIQNPIAFKDGKLAGRTGHFNDSIASFKIDVTLDQKTSERVCFYLGLKHDKNEISQTIEKYKSFQAVDDSFEGVKNRWSQILSPLEIITPDDSMNFTVNKWFRYQAIAGRLWGRTAYYQQSGALGYRDQLQDSLVFLPIDPSLTKKQIKLHARHQNEDGTVLHWWHPISEIGLQTKMTDDLLWLPFVIINYIDETGDYSILDEVEPFYNSADSATLFEHCRRAIEIVLSRFSERGIPLIGAGDWNDGLSAVGLDMKGESMWLAEFLFLIMNRFSEVAEHLDQKDYAARCISKSAELKSAFTQHSWDGEWFIGATKDSGEKLGSKESLEGKIYLNTQTWAVIADITDAERKKTAMDSVTKHLLRDNGTLLLAPAYSTPDKYIGYLSRYAAGKRENGGVYSHAAAWSIWAYALMGEPEMPYEIFKRLCPIYSGMNPDKYVAEPYVMPGNIDGPDSPNYGMAGWTWYTGSAAWFQKVIVDWILGIRATGDGLLIDPNIPKEWDKFFVKRSYRGCEYHITVNNDEHVSQGVKYILIDGNKINSNIVPPLSRCKVAVDVFMGS
ncbi:MAG: glycosyl hydrolase family 65 protein [bacterium]